MITRLIDWLGLKNRVLTSFVFGFGWAAYRLDRLGTIADGFTADDFPKVVTAVDRLHPADQATHAVSHQYRLINRRMPMTWVKGVSHFAQITSQLRSAEPKWLARRVQIEPELIPLANLRKASQIIEHVHPCQRTGPQSVNHQHGNSLRIVWLQHVKPAVLERVFHVKQAFGCMISLAKIRAIQKEGERRCQIGFQWHPMIGQLNLVGCQRIKELEYAFGGFPGSRRLRSV